MGRPFVCRIAGTPSHAERLFGMMSIASWGRSVVRASAAAASLTGAGSAAACTLCHSSQAISIRARLLGPDLLWNLAAVVLPLTLLLAVIVLVLHEPAIGEGTA